MIRWGIAVLSIGILGCQAQGPKKINLKVQKDRDSYSIGMDIGSALKREGMDLNADALGQGIKDEMEGRKTLLSEAEKTETLNALQKRRLAERQAAEQKVAEENKKAGEAFLAENKTKEGVVTLPSGLQYKIIKKGTGKKPTATSTVTVHYRGTLINGEEFDSSYKRGHPATFKLNRVIKGWQEGLQLMKKGAKWKFFVPPDLAYGEHKAGPKIGPNSTLVFDVELLDVK